MMFEKIFRKPQKEVTRVVSEEEKRIGKRFAMKYSDLSTPIAYERQNDYTSTTIMCNYYNLSLEPIAELYTVVEYIGNGEYLDLITGEIYVGQICDEKILDTVTRRYEKEALKVQSHLLHYPLAVGSLDMHNRCVGMRELTPEMKQRIMEETLPRKAEVISALSLIKENAKKKIISFYQSINKGSMLRQQKAAEKDNKEFDEQRVYEAYLEAQKRREQERLEAEEELRRQVDPEFDALFSKNIAQKILKLKR